MKDLNGSRELLPLPTHIAIINRESMVKMKEGSGLPSVGKPSPTKRVGQESEDQPSPLPLKKRLRQRPPVNYREVEWEKDSVDR